MRRPFVTLISSTHKYIIMQRICIVLLSISVLTSLTGCAEINPFAASGNPEDSVYSQFSDIPVPKDMSTNAGRTFVNYGQDGTKIGLETLEGRINVTTLTRVMINNMLRDGWALRATASGSSRYMQLFERENRYAVIYYYEQTASFAMEIWVATRLAEGAYQPQPLTNSTPSAGNYAPTDSGSSIPVYHGGDASSGSPAGNTSATSGTSAPGGLQERSLP